MSNYNWERGTIKLPAKDYPKVRDAVIAAHNAEMERVYNKAVSVYDKLTKVLKGKRGIDKQLFLNDEFYRKEKGFDANCLGTMRRDKWADPHQELDWRVEATLFPYDREKKEYRKNPLKPKKKDFPKATKSTRSFSAEEASVTFDPKAKTVTWDVGENNRAVERAAETWLAKALFGALNRVTWTARTGGTIVGNDEYNRDSDHPGGGGNYVTREFSKNAQAEAKRYSFARRSVAGPNRRWY